MKKKPHMDHHHSKPQIDHKALLCAVQACAESLPKIVQRLARIAEAVEKLSASVPVPPKRIPTYLTVAPKGPLQQD